MCIRDSTDPSQEPSREAALLLQLLFQALHLYQPVSYTHLDVYKRQLYQQLSVLVFKPLPLLSLLQLFFCRGDFLLKPLIFFLQREGVEMPLCRSVYEVLYHGVAVQDVVSSLMRRAKKDELTETTWL